MRRHANNARKIASRHRCFAPKHISITCPLIDVCFGTPDAMYVPRRMRLSVCYPRLTWASMAMISSFLRRAAVSMAIAPCPPSSKRLCDRAIFLSYSSIASREKKIPPQHHQRRKHHEWQDRNRQREEKERDRKTKDMRG